MRYFIIAGEKSGDMHAANLAKSIKEIDSDAILEGWGGEDMKANGVLLHQHIRDLAFMGFDLIGSLPKILRLFKECKIQIEAFKPDVLILVDYAGFNLRMAKWAKSKSIKTSFYIAPKTWAWNEGRVKKLRKYVDQLLVIFPFEEAYFRGFGINTIYVGNPLWDKINAFNRSRNQNEKQSEVIALLPGSRKKEIEKMTSVMVDIARLFPHLKFEVAAISEMKMLYSYFENISNIKVSFDNAYDILCRSKMAIATSGTATLETALFRIPMVVVFKTSFFSYFIAKSLIKIRFISLVNIILNKNAVPELIQEQYNLENLKIWINKLTENSVERVSQLNDFEVLINSLQNTKASEKAAVEILKTIKK